MEIRLSRRATIPDPLRVARYQKVPELGPKILFFSGGSALKEISQKIIEYTHNSMHIITSFDSGGSSAEIRRAFGMISVGDVRNRLMALADQSVKGNPHIYRLFAYRFPTNQDQSDLLKLLSDIIYERNELILEVPNPMRKIICNHLKYFARNMGKEFNLNGASVGNMVLAGGHFIQHHDLDPVIYMFSRLVEVRGEVRPIVSEDLHLAAELENGEVLIGQHNLTGKEKNPIQSPVKRLSLSSDPDKLEPVSVAINDKIKSMISNAELIVFPMGSFYSSVVCNILPTGVGSAVANNPCPKVFFLNMGKDPEQEGMTPVKAVDTLLRYLRQDAGQVPSEDLLTYVIIDSKAMDIDPDTIKSIERLGPKVVDLPLQNGEKKYQSDKFCEVLMSLV